MKFTPKQLEENVNVSRSHPLAELAWLLGGLVLLAGVLFFLLGLAADWAAAKTPISLETRLGQLALQDLPGTENEPLTERLQALLSSLPENSPLHQYRFRIFLSPSAEVNALALPGGNILVFSGLIKEIRSENELLMILAHELGHFAHRDHLRGLGRGLGVAVAASLLFGQDNAAGDLISKTFLTFQVRYSQRQESAADRFGLELLTRHYGHCGGATDFFSRLAAESGSRIPYLLASHPHPQARIDALNRIIAQQNYPVAAVLPLGADLKSID